MGPATFCEGRVTIHHCCTGGGGRKNHDKVIGICWNHHLGAAGIDGGVISKRRWQQVHGTEESLMEKTERKLDEMYNYQTVF